MNVAGNGAHGATARGSFRITGRRGSSVRSAGSDVDGDGSKDNLFIVATSRAWFIAVLWTSPGANQPISRLALPMPALPALRADGERIVIARLRLIDFQQGGQEQLYTADVFGMAVLVTLVRHGAIGRRLSLGRSAFLSDTVEAAGDLDGDGRGDLIAAGEPWRFDITTVDRRESRRLQNVHTVLLPLPAWSYRSDSTRRCSPAGDLDGDQRADLACIESRVTPDSSAMLPSSPRTFRLSYFHREDVGLRQVDAFEDLRCFHSPTVCPINGIASGDSSGLLIACASDAGAAGNELLSVAFDGSPMRAHWRRVAAPWAALETRLDRPALDSVCGAANVVDRRAEFFPVEDLDGDGINDVIAVEFREECRDNLLVVAIGSSGSRRSLPQHIDIRAPMVAPRFDEDDELTTLALFDGEEAIRGSVLRPRFTLGRAELMRSRAP